MLHDWKTGQVKVRLEQNKKQKNNIVHDRGTAVFRFHVFMPFMFHGTYLALKPGSPESHSVIPWESKASGHC